MNVNLYHESHVTPFRSRKVKGHQADWRRYRKST